MLACKCVVGLGNPGATYAKTRHNAGFMLLDGILDGAIPNSFHFPLGKLDFIRRFLGVKASFRKSHGPFVSIDAEFGGSRCCFVKPMTFMNESGTALTSLRTRGMLKKNSELLVVVDDAELDIGRIRLRAKGSAGGHNGLKSIIQHLGSDDFARIRIGIGPIEKNCHEITKAHHKKIYHGDTETQSNYDDKIDFVLGTFTADELAILQKSFGNAAQIIEAWVDGGLPTAQNVFSRL